MNRKQFIIAASAIPFAGAAMPLHKLNRFLSEDESTAKMPVLFLGHGNPMNAIEENEFVTSFRKLGQEIAKPTAILVISAHWETRGTLVTAMDNPPTIHDFGGFPQALFDVQYPAPGSPELAKATQQLITQTEVHLDDKWGLDHGSWSVVKHLYPNADVPIIQMSIDYTQPASYHYALAQELSRLRHKGVLIIGSGNMVHNLRMVSWQHLNTTYGFDWALEANTKMKEFIADGNHQALINFRQQGKEFDLAIPTPEHYLPLLYSLALQEKNEAIEIFNDSPVGGSLTMTSIKIG
ncbi:4,5-DOPA-extradiol-dioxygenase [Sphingobacterium psychroaquaticum]|uniref:Aromatic ring-opening dioxygenase, catalytic subunit, LigB family n=1 Tax=Sphingobacterium psychroaquaticum TaxID=561061 RepID=A0A1X7IHQ6_9SPHI|nr:4,5-DOPA dioxygenase extradiol [Sphingobacterium psychroaquaticum]SMG13849.1 Aromatic ring-opening dioxygenase, catalytic subunit, LigB family [Sphingobacterium psychroaquaticum]